MQIIEIEKINERFSGKSTESVIEYALNHIGYEQIVLASSLSIEDQVLTHMVLSIEPKARVFFLDTGRHYQETYKLMKATMDKYQFKYEVYAPNHVSLEAMISKYGPNLFYDSVELRKMCCYVRKVEPLNRVLSGVDGWICGLRRGQSLERSSIRFFEQDEQNNLIKINPLAFWSEDDVWNYVRKEDIPYNTLHLKGFPSIGCQPCTRAVQEGNDIRSGRWWWENTNHKECGLHSR